jgi:hypothetical protein
MLYLAFTIGKNRVLLSTSMGVIIGDFLQMLNEKKIIYRGSPDRLPLIFLIQFIYESTASQYRRN